MKLARKQSRWLNLARHGQNEDWKVKASVPGSFHQDLLRIGNGRHVTQALMFFGSGKRMRLVSCVERWGESGLQYPLRAKKFLPAHVLRRAVK